MPTVERLATRLHREIVALRVWEVEDLVQDSVAKAISKAKTFRGESALTTWVVTLARNHMIGMARSVKNKRPRRLSIDPVHTDDPARRMILRGSTTDLLDWLNDHPSEVDQGWQVLNLLLWSHGNVDYVALALTLHTGHPWTTTRVRNVIKKIKSTGKGWALCSSLGLADKLED